MKISEFSEVSILLYRQNRKIGISESFFLLEFLVVYETKKEQANTKKVPTLRFFLMRKNKNIQDFLVFNFDLYVSKIKNP